MEKEQLDRSISKFGFALIAINGLIGAGIFALPGKASAAAGLFSPWLFLICGLLMATIVLSFAKLSSFFEGTGGPIVYAEKAYGPFVAFQTGWLLYLGRATALAANANALVFYLSLFFPKLRDGIANTSALVVLILMLSASNLFGVKSAVGTLTVATLLKITPLLVFIVLGIPHLDMNASFSTQGFELETMGASLLVLVYAFVGFEGAVVPAGEAKNPAKDIPRALVMTLVFTSMLYFFVQLITQSILPELAQSKTPIADAAGISMGTWGITLMTAVAIISIAGNLASTMLAAPRMTYSMGLSKHIHQWFAHVNDRTHVPQNSIVFFTVLTLVLATTGTFLQLAIMSSLTRLLGYSVCISALPAINKSLPEKKDNFDLWGGFTIPGLALFVCLWLMTQAQMNAWLMTAGFIIGGGVLYVLNQGKLRSRK